MAEERLSGLSVFLPVHNEVDALGPQVDQAFGVLPVVGDRLEVIMVDDGSAELAIYSSLTRDRRCR